MSHSSLAATAVPAGPPAFPLLVPPPTAKRRGNPDLGLALRCGAQTRAGCPCQAPAIHGKIRCRMHGGRSTGPRSPEGMARVRAARTIHGAYSAETRALNRHDLTALRRGHVGNAAARYIDRLPPDLAARLMQMPLELLPPPWPTGGLTPAEDRAVLHAEAEALAPWRDAIAQATHARRPSRRMPHPVAGGLSRAQSEPHAAVPPCRNPEGLADAADTPLADFTTETHAPDRAAATDGAASTAPPAAHGGAMPSQAEAHAPVPPRRDPEGLADGADRLLADVATKAHAPVRATSTASPTASQPARAKVHAPDDAADTQRGAATAPPAANRSVAALQSKAHAPEVALTASAAIPATGANRAERRRLKYLQRRLRQTLAPCLRP